MSRFDEDKPLIWAICHFMEPHPVSRTRSRDSEHGWWRLIGFDRKQATWRPNLGITLDRLCEVEAKLSDAQRSKYDRELNHIVQQTNPKIVYLWHASAEQKIEALAIVIRGAFTSRAENTP